MIRSRYSVDQSCGRGHGAGLQRADGGVAADLAAGLDQRGQDGAEQAVGGVAVAEQALGGTADAGAAELGVEGDVECQAGVGAAVQVDVAVAVEVGEDGDAALRLHALDQRAAAAGDDDVDQALHAQEVADGGAVGGGDELDRGRRQASRLEAALEAGDDGARGVEALRAAAQDAGIAGLEAQGTGVGRHVGAALVDDADHAQRHRDPGDVEAVGARPAGELAADGVRQIGDRGETVRHRGDTLAVEAQTVEQGRGQALRFRGLHVGGVGGLDGGGLVAQQPGCRLQGRVLGRPWGQRQLARGIPGSQTQIVHASLEIVLQRRRHGPSPLGVGLERRTGQSKAVRGGDRLAAPGRAASAARREPRSSAGAGPRWRGSGSR